MSREFIREFELVPAGTVQVELLDEPPVPPEGKAIHQRRFTPLVPEIAPERAVCAMELRGSSQEA